MTKPSSPCILVIFGATGDLTARKLIPALYHLYKDLQKKKLPYMGFICVGVARKVKSDETFREEQKRWCNEYARSGPVDTATWNDFASRIFYHTTEFSDKEGYPFLRSYLDSLDVQYGTRGNRIYYLATQSEYFPVIVRNLYENKMLYNRENTWSRVVIEKPFGRDLESSKALQKQLSTYLSEEQIYRIDHYLGKLYVENFPEFIFKNRCIGTGWTHKDIDSIQITISESIGIETRGHFFEKEGILRDIVQNHIMQILSSIAMEPPKYLDSSSIQSAKVDLLKSIKPFTYKRCKTDVIRGQYRGGIINGEKISGYREEKDVDVNSCVETFVAMKLYIKNKRWKNVPFYIRVGKRLKKRLAEINIIYKPGLYCDNHSATNLLSFHIQPEEGFSLDLYSKSPDLTRETCFINWPFRSKEFFKKQTPEAYERLLLDCMCGIRTLFTTQEELMESWRILTPILKYWEKHPPDFPNYAVGTWGPEGSSDLLKNDGRKWIVE